MPDYAKMYQLLFNSQTDAIALQEQVMVTSLYQPPKEKGPAAQAIQGFAGLMICEKALCKSAFFGKPQTFFNFLKRH